MRVKVPGGEQVVLVMLHPLQRPLPHPGRGVALDHAQGVQADDQLRVAINGVDVRSKRPVHQHPHHDSAKFGNDWHTGFFCFGQAAQHDHGGLPVVTCVNQRPCPPAVKADLMPGRFPAKSAGISAPPHAKLRSLCAALRTACTPRRITSNNVLPARE